MRNDPSTYWNKALGFGFAEPITDALIGQVMAFYRANRSPRAVLQIAPEALPSNWDEIAAAHGLRPGHNIQKLAAQIDELQFGSSDLRVEEIGPEDAQEWAAIVLAAFGMPGKALAT